MSYTSQNTRVCTDQLGRSVEISFRPQRIISLVPSVTDLLHYLGLDSRVVSVTKFCERPEGWRECKTIVGGTKNLRLDVIRGLKPDLVLASKEENVKDQIELLAGEFPVWVSDVTDMHSALEMIEMVGKLTNSEVCATELTHQIKLRFEHIKLPASRIRVVYLIWKDPWMAAGKDTFIHAMLSSTGFENAVDSTRYPSLSTHDLVNLNPDAVLLSSEPYPFKNHHVAEMQQLLCNAMVERVDGQLFSWYGPRMLYLPEYAEKLHRKLSTNQHT
ncbi:MAG: helical backbone metal receptor [Salibacteraceae bacterium]